MSSSSKRKRKRKSGAKAEPAASPKPKAKAAAPQPQKQQLPSAFPSLSQYGRVPVQPPTETTAEPAPAKETSSPAGSPPTAVRAPYSGPAVAGDPRLPQAWIVGTIAAIIGVGILLTHLGTHRWVNSDQRISQAQTALRQQNWPAALGAIKEVQEESRQLPAFQRVLADYLEETRSSPHALLEVLEKLKQSGEFRPMDQLWLCRAWLATKHLDKARAAWDSIPPPLCEGLEATRLKVELLYEEGQLREAAQLQQDLNAEFADVPLVAVRLAVAEINGPFPEVRHKAHTRLWELAQRRDPAGLEALRMLGSQTGRTEKESADLLALISKHPLATPADRQGITSLLMQLSPARRNELLQTEITRCEAQDPLALALWLAREGETERLQQLSPELRRLQPVVWFQTVARALAEAKQWQELLKLVQQQQARQGTISPAELLRWRAVAQRQLHPQDVVAPYADLQHSIRQGAAEKNFASVALSAQIAEDWHMLDLALEAGLVLAQPETPKEAQMLENCQRIATLLKDSDVLAEIAARLTALQPENVQYARQDAYLRLLRGEQIETTVIAVHTTSNHNAASLLAMALKAWRLHDHPRAAHTLLQLHDTTTLTTGERAVYAGLLATACGKVSHAYQIAEKIRPELLLPEELTFLKMAL